VVAVFPGSVEFGIARRLICHHTGVATGTTTSTSLLYRLLLGGTFHRRHWVSPRLCSVRCRGMLRRHNKSAFARSADQIGIRVSASRLLRKRSPRLH
jgi:hypothetical protein